MTNVATNVEGSQKAIKTNITKYSKCNFCRVSNEELSTLYIKSKRNGKF